MKAKLACAVLFLFALATPVVSQQNFVRLGDDKNPCRSYKIIVLIPADTTAVERSVRKPDDSIDAKMVWNPCPQTSVSVAAIPAPMAPKRWNIFAISELGILKLQSSGTPSDPSPLLPKRERWRPNL